MGLSRYLQARETGSTAWKAARGSTIVRCGCILGMADAISSPELPCRWTWEVHVCSSEPDRIPDNCRFPVRGIEAIRDALPAGPITCLTRQCELKIVGPSGWRWVGDELCRLGEPCSELGLCEATDISSTGLLWCLYYSPLLSCSDPESFMTVDHNHSLPRHSPRG